MKKVLIIGATSAIAEATARQFAAQGCQLALLGRNTERLESMCKDLKIRGAQTVDSFQLDVNDATKRLTIIDQAVEKMAGIDILFIAHGTLPDQSKCEHDMALIEQEVSTNATSILVMVSHLANHFEQQRHGSIVVISSVAGDRGRQSNYIYGAAKGMVTIFLQGLRNRLYKANVQVLTIKPGFVDTPMTADMKKGLLWVQPDTIAAGIIKGIAKGKSEMYLPGFWALIMLVIRTIPGFIFNRMSL